VCQIRFSISGPAARLTFRGEYGRLVELAIEGDVLLRRGRDELALTGAQPGITFNPRELHPLLELLDTQVSAVFAGTAGDVRLTFSNDWELSLRDDEFDYPAWRLRSDGVSLL
jgi:hypothetical protein